MYSSLCTIREKCLNKRKCIVPLFRFYHSQKGVYGYRPQEIIKTEIEPGVISNRIKQCNVNQFINAYRTHAHRIATINPVEFTPNSESISALQPERYGLTKESNLNVEGLFFDGTQTTNLEELLAKLHEIYAENISYEFMYLENEEELEWFAKRIESSARDQVSNVEKATIAKDLIKSQAWDNFCATKFPAVKRYGGEGVESMLTFYRTIFKLAVQDGLEDIVANIPHRGKFNIYTGLCNFEPVIIFNKFKGNSEFPDTVNAMGDVTSHLGVSTDLNVDGKKIHFSATNTPSHLEVANAVAMGKTRSKQMNSQEGDYDPSGNSRRSDKVLNIQVHTDAAISGQGINQEIVALSQVPHNSVGGTIHFVVNNQVGFTTPYDRARSSRYCTDLAKFINAPVLHVNGDYPELVHKASQIAFEYQRKFRKDIFIDYNGFRKWGHNELDDPTFTNPSLYKVINNRKSIPDVFVDKMISEGVLSPDDVKNVVQEHNDYLQQELNKVEHYVPEPIYFQRQWSKMTLPPNAVETWHTGVSDKTLRHIGGRSVDVPPQFTIHPHLKKTYIKNRIKKIEEGRNLDWATAEALAFGSLLLDGHNVRISGEDVGRGTFSHRHAMLVDYETNEMYIPLNNIASKQKGYLEVANSILSEEAVLAFEYGMSIDSPDNLIIWEAQFGDFFNGAQIIFDTYIASGQTKWMRSSGLVVLLPHGYDGVASDHSSCRMERFLQLTDSKEAAVDGDDVNMDVVNPTTPAQYFHLLRRQMVRDYRKPLIVVAPKTLLRLSEATSDMNELVHGTFFKPVIGDYIADPLKVKKIIFVSGKHYYLLNNERITNNIDDVAIIRVESLCPFPVHHLTEELNKYKNARTFVWSQEEHRNMGAWSFVKPRFENLVGRKLIYSGRAEAPTTAVGIAKIHRAEIEHIVKDPFYNIR